MNIELHSDRFNQCFYRKYGNGFPVVLLHGFGENSNIFKYQIEFLKEDYTVIVPDLPGSGMSALPAEEMTMELLADFVHEILLQEKMQKVILLGHSMGGYATLAFAERYRDELLAFGLIHSSAYEDDSTKKENRRKSIKLIRNEGKEVFLKAMVPNLYSERSKREIPQELDFHLTMALEISSDSLVAYYNAMINRPDRTHILRDNNLPVLFVIGKEDNAIPYRDMLAQSIMTNISSIELFEDTGHTGMLEMPQKVNETLNNFCKYVLANNFA